MSSRVRAGSTPVQWPIMLRSGDARARIRPHWNDSSLAQLTFLDSGEAPSSPSIQVWLGELRARGFTGVRTGAVTDMSADALRRQGFETIQTLRLLDMSLLGWRPPAASSAIRTRRLRDGERVSAAEVDRAAFGDQWAIDSIGIDETCNATPSYRARAIDSESPSRPRSIAGFAVTGRADRTGYLQRLAVHPLDQGIGVGFSLTRDSLVWMQRRRLTRAIVNTHTDNVTALALYQRIGFRILPQGLSVMHRRLDDL